MSFAYNYMYLIDQSTLTPLTTALNKQLEWFKCNIIYFITSMEPKQTSGSWALC